MNEKIKEILDKLKDSVDNPIIDVPTYDGSDSEPMDNIAIIKPNACKQLLDYITNLQKENKILKENAEHNDKVVDKARWNEMIYKSRCKKAIEYIEEHYYMELEYDKRPKRLKHILNGSDENDS